MAIPLPDQSIVISIAQLASRASIRKTRRFCIVSAGDTSLGKGEYKVLNAQNWNQTITSSSSESYKVAQSFYSQNETEGKELVVFETTSNGSAQQKIQTLTSFIQGGTYPIWAFYIPSTLVADASFGTLATTYSTPTSSTYFIVVLDNVPASSAWFATNAQGKKSVFACYNTLADTNLNIGGVFMGIMASRAYDISLSTQLNTLNNRYAQGTAKTIDLSTKTALTNAFVNWVGNVSGNNVALNGKFCDGNSFSFWFGFDTLIENLKSDISYLAVSSANSKTSPLKFNDVGITMLRERIKATFNTGKKMGIVDRFGKSLDVSTGYIVGEDRLQYTPSAIYKAEFPENVKNGIYDAFSCYVEIQRFIQQVQLSIQI